MALRISSIVSSVSQCQSHSPLVYSFGQFCPQHFQKHTPTTWCLLQRFLLKQSPLAILLTSLRGNTKDRIRADCHRIYRIWALLIELAIWGHLKVFSMGRFFFFGLRWTTRGSHVWSDTAQTWTKVYTTR
jgi:hypothetical protein